MWNTKSTISSSYSQKASTLTLMSSTYKLHKAQMRLDEAKRVKEEVKAKQVNGEPSQSQGWTSV